MKYLLLLVLLTFVIISDTKVNAAKETYRVENSMYVITYDIVIIGECEYISYRFPGCKEASAGLTHKGDCKNPKHRDNQ